MRNRRNYLITVSMAMICVFVLHYFITFKDLMLSVGLEMEDRDDATRTSTESPSDQGKLKESFTVIIPTTDLRIKSLLATIKQLINIQQLNRFLILWNDVGKKPPPELRNLSISSPVIIKEMPINSLNNRFKDFEEVKTDAVLCMDDDIITNQKDILSAFRVWLKDKSRLVGFYDRYHTWNNISKTWNYFPTYKKGLCKSMVLTKAMLYHKKYNKIYSSRSLEAIRSEVDRLKNCEDLAMNFVVSDITRKPPIFMNRTFQEFCPSCRGVSTQHNHFNERSLCLNIFSKIFKYMPLLC